MKLSESSLFNTLADGKLYSGQQLADKFGVSRTAIWKHLESLRNKGMALESIRGKGYRLQSPIEVLDLKTIRSCLPSVPSLERLEVLNEIDSTSRYLRTCLNDVSIHRSVVLAEYQTGGRGRGNNEWLSAPGAGLCISIGWHYDSAPGTLPALSLATGVVLAGCLAGFGPQSINLKWPNDLLFKGAKLGGVLIESRGQLAGAVDVIIGIGINIDMPEHIAGQIRQPVTDLTRVFGYRPSRNQLAALIIENMFRMLEQYPRHGFETYIDAWRKLDITRGNDAVLLRSSGQVSGRVMDIDENGFLIMETAGEKNRYSSGDLSLRLVK